MEKSKSFEELIVWQKAHSLTLATYKLTSLFPNSELYAMTSQMRRAAYSIPSNIAEGYAKRSTKDKARFYNIAQGSLSELRYFVLLSRDLEYHDQKEFLNRQMDEVGKLLNAYISKININS
jgi:four helix bundle protein